MSQTPPVANKNQSTTFIPDQPSKTDYLDFDPYVNALVDLILSPNTQTPLTLSIFGSWGSGKSTLMQLMEQVAGKRRVTQAPRLELLWMNVWQLSQHGEGWKAFLQSLFTRVHKSLPLHKRVFFDLRLLADRINKTGLLRQLLPNLYRILIVIAPFLLARFLPNNSDPVTTAIRNPEIRNATAALLGLWLLVKPVFEAAKDKVSLDLGKVLKDAPYELQISALQKLQEHFELLVKTAVKKDGRLIVFIDDLDRCSPDKIAEVLEALKLFATTPNCVYVLAVDQQVVAQSIQAKYKESAGVARDGALIDGARYLEKIVQLPFWLPTIEIDDIRGYVNSFNAAWPHPGCADIFIQALPPNPRQVKRAINFFFLLWQLAKHREKKLGTTITPLRLAKVVVVQTTHADVWEVLKASPPALREVEAHSLKSPVDQDIALQNNLLSPSLHDAVKRPGLQRLFQLNQDDPLALFGGLIDTDLAAFFSLTRPVTLPSVEESGVVAEPVESEKRPEEATAVTPSPSPPSIISLRQLPPPPRDFTGRNVELDELLSSAKDTGVPIVISGLGGVGKTSLALKLAEQLTPLYSDAQLFLNLRGTTPEPISPSEAMAHVIRSYYPTAKLPERLADLKGLYTSVLNGQRALLLLDNAANENQLEPLIPPSSCILLVTSRKQLALAGAVSKNLDTLSPEEARALLLTIEPRIGQYASEMAKLAGNLPLALRLMASAMVQFRNISPQDYLKRLANAQERLKLVDASINLSYEWLSPDMQRFWCGLAVFPGTFDAAAAAGIWKTEAAEAQEILGKLLAYSLVEWDSSSDRYHLNDLLRLFADAQLKADLREAAHLRHAAHYLTVLRQADERYREGGEAFGHGLRLFDVEWNNIKAGQAWAEEQSAGNARAAELTISYPNVGAHLLDLRQPPRERIHWFEVALAAAKRLNRSEAEAILLSNLGSTYSELGEIAKAIEFYQTSLRIARENGIRSIEGAALGNLGLANATLKNYAEAIEYLEQQLSISRETSDRAGVGTTLGNLAVVYGETGDTKRAIDFYEQRLVIAREFGDRRSEGNALSNLGSMYFVLGDFRRAVELQEQALAIAREIGDLRGEAKALYNASLSLDQLGERAKAIANAEVALAVYEKLEDPNAERIRKQLDQWATPGS